MGAAGGGGGGGGRVSFIHHCGCDWCGLFPIFPAEGFFFKAQAKPSVFAFSVVTLVNAHRERPCEGFSGFSLS